MGTHWIETAARHWRHRRIVGHRFAERRAGIRAALRAAEPGSVLLAGNSHAEFVGAPDLGGRTCINIAVGGSTAADCGRQLAALRVPVRCAAAVLIIGTNDIQRWRHPERARVVDRFEADVRGILRRLEAWAAQVLVAAIPPIGAGATGRDPAAVAAFSDRLAALCAAGGHAFFDPFAPWRSGAGGLAGAGLHRDGVHLADYAPLAAALARAVAVDRGGTDAVPPAPVRRPAPAAPVRVLRAAWIGRP
ncbi:SGNH/GDSL hydrolase family protein [Methylobacterium sp. C33D]|uniref:SGNH/GDSL hydrolase family protein n=1 Tax=Methylobacterium mesophilicum TaxID=39956 RepID=UPI002F2CD8B1